MTSCTFVKKVCVVSLLVFTFSGCLPQEKPLTEKDLASEERESFGGFAGVDTVETVAASKLRVKWTASEDERVVAYNIYDVTLTLKPKLLKTVPAPQAEATIAGLSHGFYYAFRVRAVDAEENEDFNSKDMAAIPYGGISNVTVLSSSSVLVAFADASDGEALEASVYCKVGDDGDYELKASVKNLSKKTAVLEELVPNTSYTCRVSINVDGFEDNNTETLTFIPMGEAAEITFVQEPGNGAAGDPLSQQPVIKILDVNGNTVAGGPDSTALVTLEFALESPSTGSVRGTAAVNAVAGIATFEGLYIQEAGVKILSAKKEDTSGEFFGSAPMQVNSDSITILPGNVSAAESILAIDPVVPPAEPLVANGSDSYVVKATLKDSFGNIISGIKPKFASNIVGDFISQPSSSTDELGESSGAITTTIADSLANPRKVTISSPSGLSDVEVTVPFKAGAAAKLAFTVQPVSSPAGVLGMNQLKVSIQDTQGNGVTDGAEATANITLAIAANVGGAVLSGTIVAAAINGTAIFSDLGIDITQTGYRLIASSGALTPAYSNSFNVTAGIPRVISITGPVDVKSGGCSLAITVQLQDFGGNPAKAIQNTPIQITGLGNSVLYSSSACGGSALGSSLTFTAGTDTRTVYLKNNTGEALTVIGQDSSSVLTQATYNINVTPSKMSMIAQAPLPAPPATPMSVVSGQCSTEIIISPLGEDGSDSQVFSATNISVAGILGSQATLFSDSGCTIALDPNVISLQMGVLPNNKTKIYIKNPKAESLLLSVTDPLAELATISLPQQVDFTASKISLTGPTTVVAGVCSTVFTVILQDTLDNAVVTSEDVPIQINGIDGVSTTAQFYTSPSCSGAGVTAALIVPQGNSAVQLYLRDWAAEILDIDISDPAMVMTTSASIQVTVTPSAFRIVAPMAGSSLTTECAGPFDIETLDGQGDPANAVLPIDMTLSGHGVAGKFFDESSCSSEVTSYTFAAGEGSKSFYFKGQYPETTLTFTATDDALVLNPGVASWTVGADWGWFGTASKSTDGNGDLLWFQPDVKPVAARYDGIYSAMSLDFDPSNQYLYVADYYRHKISKYDYTNHTYIGWMGKLRYDGGVGASGSNLTTPSPALCVGTTHSQTLPGWCTGGRPYGTGISTGGVYYPYGVHDDGTYLYVTSYHGHGMSRFNSLTGEFAGWVGYITSATPTASAIGGPATCTTAPNNSVTPGWCIGGNYGYNGAPWNDFPGNGSLRYPSAVTSDANFLYVGSSASVLRFSKFDGSFQGWIGAVVTTPTGGAAGCTSVSPSQITPGWCMGGSSTEANPTNHAGNAGGIRYARSIVINGSDLYIINEGYGGVINRYNKDTGAFVETLANLSFNWAAPRQAAFDGTNFFIADDKRVIKTSSTGLVEGWIGKVSNNSNMSGSAGCNTLLPNENTPGWCLGGTAKSGLDEDSFINTRALVLDGSGSFLVGSEDSPGIKKFNAVTGAYEGTLALQDNSPTEWSNDRTSNAEFHGFSDGSTWQPMGPHVSGDFLFVSEHLGSRLKKISRLTGELLGWVGAVTSKPTGGQSPLCLIANAMGPSPSWCLGSSFYPSFTWNDSNMIDDLTDGIMRNPHSTTSDGTWVYITDRGLHRVQRFKISDGSSGGWVGKISVSPTGGDPGCNGATVGTFTPGWCTGGISTWGIDDGMLYQPSGMTYLAGNLYVVDSRNGRISSYSAITGGFNGWIGAVATDPTSGCTFSSNGVNTVSDNGWCKGGTGLRVTHWTDRGGGFRLVGDRGDITSDGLHLYVTNGYHGRIDKYDLNGVYQGATKVRADQYINTWETDPNLIGAMGVGCDYPLSIWVDGNYIYGTNSYPCSASYGETLRVWKMDKALGQIIGWKGGIDPSFSPTGGDQGCAGATISTPGWCTGGRPGVGLKLGQFGGPYGYITGDQHFLYVTDETSNRVVRLPK